MVCNAVEEYAEKKAAIREAIEAGFAYGADKEVVIARVNTEFGISVEEAEKLYNTYAKSIA